MGLGVPIELVIKHKAGWRHEKESWISVLLGGGSADVM